MQLTVELELGLSKIETGHTYEELSLLVITQDITALLQVDRALAVVAADVCVTGGVGLVRVRRSALPRRTDLRKRGG